MRRGKFILIINRLCLRVGYPANLAAEWLSDFPQGIDLIRLPRDLDHDEEIDVWIPGSLSDQESEDRSPLTGSEAGSFVDGGNGMDSTAVDGPHVTICNARGAHNISTAEWTLSAILAMLKHFPLFLEIQKSGDWKRRSEASAEYVGISGDARPLYPPVMLEELTGKTVLLVGYGSIGKEIERMLEPFRVDLIRVARTARETPKVHAIGELDALLPRAQVVVLILPSSPETRWLMDAKQFSLMQQGALLVNAARGPIVNTDALVEALKSGTDSRSAGCDRSRTAAGRSSVVEVSEPADHAACGRIEPGVCAARAPVAADELRRYMAGEPLLNVVQAAV